MDDILDDPIAQELLDETTVAPATVATCAGRVARFLQRYLPHFYRAEQRELAQVHLEGRLSGLQRKTLEPIATNAGRPRRGLQRFVGAGQWDDDAVLGELHAHVAEVIGHADGVLIADGYGVAKKGRHSCGVARQWCGRLGKVENCQVGVVIGYAAPLGKALLSDRLYLTEEWAADPVRRALTYVPTAVVFQEKWRIALDLLQGVRQRVQHAWVVADDDYGRVSLFRETLRGWREPYVLDVPCSTSICDCASGCAGDRPVWERADAWVARQPTKRWKRLHVRDGEKGPLVVDVLRAKVLTRDEGRLAGAYEDLLVIRSREKQPRVWYALSHSAGRKVKVWQQVAAHGQRHCIEELLEEGNGEVGMDHWEVRSWVGWHHHMALAILALWFLQVERLRLGEKKSGADGGPGAADLHGVAARPAGEPAADQRSRQPRAAA